MVLLWSYSGRKTQKDKIKLWNYFPFTEKPIGKEIFELCCREREGGRQLTWKVAADVDTMGAPAGLNLSACWDRLGKVYSIHSTKKIIWWASRRAFDKTMMRNLSLQDRMPDRYPTPCCSLSRVRLLHRPRRAVQKKSLPWRPNVPAASLAPSWYGRSWSLGLRWSWGSRGRTENHIEMRVRPRRRSHTARWSLGFARHGRWRAPRVQHSWRWRDQERPSKGRK